MASCSIPACRYCPGISVFRRDEGAEDRPFLDYTEMLEMTPTLLVKAGAMSRLAKLRP